MPHERVEDFLLSTHFFKKGAGKYRIYYEFYKATNLPIPYTSKLGTLTTSVFNIK